MPIKKNKEFEKVGKRKIIDLTSHPVKQKVKIILICLILTYVFCAIFNSLYLVFNGLNGFRAMNLPWNAFMLTFKISWPLMFGLILINIFVARLALSKHKKRLDDGRGYKVAKGFEDISVVFMQDEEKRKRFNLLPPESPQGGVILGIEEKTGETIILPFNHPDFNYAPPNHHLMLFGSSGTRKTSAFIIPRVWSSLWSGRNVVATDPKGEVCEKTIAAAMAFNYNVKFLNFIKFENSDGVDILRYIKEADDPYSAADFMTETLMDNIGGEGRTGDPFWVEANRNCLKLALLCVSKAKGFISSSKKNAKGDYRTITAFYDLIASPDFKAKVKNIIDNGANNGDAEMLHHAYNTWSSHDKAEDIRAGLATKLSSFQNPNIARLFSEDEIRFEDFNDKKTILYIISPDISTEYTTILALFVNILIKTVTNIADANPSLHLERPLDIVVEEAKNIGKITGLAKYMAMLRSRHITISLCYQNLGQLQDSYGASIGGKKEWETITGNCGMSLYFGVEDETTTEYFSFRSGKYIGEKAMDAIQIPTLSPIKWAATKRYTRTSEEKVLLRPDQLAKMPLDKVLICPFAAPVTMEKKYFYMNHPLFDIRLVNRKTGKEVKFHYSQHMPSWKKLDLEREVMKDGGLVDPSLFEEDFGEPVVIENYYNKNKRAIHSGDDYETLNPILEKFRGLIFKDESSDEQEYKYTSSSKSYKNFMKHSTDTSFDSSFDEFLNEEESIEDEVGVSNDITESFSPYISPPAKYDSFDEWED